MRYTRIFFISGLLPELSNNTYPDPGIAYIIENAKPLGIEYDFLDNRLGYKSINIIKRIADFNPDLIAVSMKTGQYLKQYEILKDFNNQFPHTKILCGGDHLTVIREQVLRDCPSIDYGIPFEGEMVFNSLIKGDEIDKIQGLIYRDKNEVKFNGFKDLIEDLDTLEFPKFEKVDFSKYTMKEVGLVSSRGCPFSCIFCVESTKGKMKRYRSRSAVNFVDEIAYWVKKGFRRFDFSEPCFNYSKERVISICDEIEKRNFPPLYFSANSGARADSMDEEVIMRLKGIGLKYLIYGVEGGNNKILDIIKKGEKLETIEKAIRLSLKHGLEVVLTFLVGTPGETLKDVEDSINFVRKFPLNSVTFNNLIPVPGSRVFEYLKKEGLFIVKPEEYLNKPWRKIHYKPLFHTPEMSISERKILLKKTKAVKREVIRKKLRRKMTARFGKILGMLMSFFFANRALVYILSLMSDTNPERFYIKFSKV
jgi:anaerobic magnesium-protoporphyrin IX monomethyl ester cyclase